jgi:hypothetical protein
MHAGARRAVQFVGRRVVAEHVAAVVGEPQCAVHRVPVEADAVADAAGEYLPPRAVGVHAQHCRIGVAGIADVAGRADRHVKLAVGAEGDELPAVVDIARQAVGNHRRRRRSGEAIVNVIVAQDAVHRADIQRAMAPGQAAGHVQSGGDSDHGAGAIGGVEAHRVHRAGPARADIKHATPGAYRAQRHLPGIVHARPELDGKARRQHDGFQRQGGGQGGPGQQDDAQGVAHGKSLGCGAIRFKAPIGAGAMTKG